MNKIIEFLKQSNRYKPYWRFVGRHFGLHPVDSALCCSCRSLLSGTERQTERRTLGLDRLVSYRHRRHIVGPILVDSVML